MGSRTADAEYPRFVATQTAVLVAISIPIFNAQLEKSRDATTMANLRNAYAEASAEYLTNQTTPVVKDVVVKGTDDNGVSDKASDLSFTLAGTTTNLDKIASGKTKVEVSFAFSSGTSGTGACEATIGNQK